MNSSHSNSYTYCYEVGQAANAKTQQLELEQRDAKSKVSTYFMMKAKLTVEEDTSEMQQYTEGRLPTKARLYLT